MEQGPAHPCPVALPLFMAPTHRRSWGCPPGVARRRARLPARCRPPPGCPAAMGEHSIGRWAAAYRVCQGFPTLVSNSCKEMCGLTKALQAGKHCRCCSRSLHASPAHCPPQLCPAARLSASPAHDGCAPPAPPPPPSAHLLLLPLGDVQHHHARPVLRHHLAGRGDAAPLDALQGGLRGGGWRWPLGQAPLASQPQPPSLQRLAA